MIGFGAKSAQTRAWIELLAQSDLLGGLHWSAIAALVSRAGPMELADGEILMRQGEPGASAYVVLSGELAVIVETPLGDVTLSSLGPGQVVGEIAIFSRMPRTATVRAVGRTSVLRLSEKDLHAVVRRRPEAAIGLLAALGRRVASLNRPLAVLTLAADAMAQADVDLDAMVGLFTGLEAEAPFARSFRRLVAEMERKQAQRQEMLVAGRLQQSILPGRLDFGALGSSYVAKALMRPSRDIGGDFYDMILTDDGRRAVLIVADVSGKGIPAALFMAISRTVIRSAVTRLGSIERALDHANTVLCAENPECLFVTLFIGELTFETGAFRYVNAGHCDGYVVRSAGDILVLPATAPAVAMLPEPRLAVQTIELGPDDRIVLVSDGVTEAFSAEGEGFGEERLQRLLVMSKAVSATDALAAVDDAVARFSTGCQQSDDITCLLVDRLSGRPG